MNNQLDLFARPEIPNQHIARPTTQAPLAEVMRPQNLTQFVGQTLVLNKIKTLKPERNYQFILFGPPGVGKTTLAKIMANELKCEFFSFNAVMSGVKELKALIDSMLEMKRLHNQKSLLFIDEIHRFNKAQQDALLPYLERGEFSFIGATTEYPQTSLNRAILSRVQILELIKLNSDDLKTILNNALNGKNATLANDIIELIANFSNGDARVALNSLSEILDQQLTELEQIKQTLLKHSRHYDKAADRHYDVISAFIKSVRGSDPDAALLWLAVMLDGGEDPDFIARRLILLASEDVGNANPQALTIACNAHYAIKNIGMPEARIPLAQATTYLAASPKSNASYLAIDAALAFVRESTTIDVPTHLRNQHPDKRNYKYPHDYPKHFVTQKYAPSTPKFLSMTELGAEKELKQYLKSLD